MKTIITATLFACFATVAHAGQQPVYVQPVNPYTGQPVPLWQLQSDLSVAEANRSAQLGHALRQIQRQNRLRQWNDSFYDLSMLIEARRTRRAVEALQPVASEPAVVSAFQPPPNTAIGGAGIAPSGTAEQASDQRKPKACPFWRKSCW